MFTFFWVIIVAASLAFSFRSLPSLIRRSMSMFSSLRLRHFGWAAVTIPSVVIPTVLLLIYVPLTRFGWLFNLTGSGEPLDPTWTGVTMSAFIVVFMVFIFFLLPVMALGEEIIFREPLVEAPWWKIIGMSLVFGLVHLVMGIPIAAALSLSVAGFIFYVIMNRSYKKEKAERIRNMSEVLSGDEETREKSLQVIRNISTDEGVRESALAHSAHNMILFGTMIVLQSWFLYTTVSTLI